MRAFNENETQEVITVHDEATLDGAEDIYLEAYAWTRAGWTRQTVAEKAINRRRVLLLSDLKRATGSTPDAYAALHRYYGGRWDNTRDDREYDGPVFD